MARILLAWELGAGFGHIAPLRVLARELHKLGHVCIFALRELEAAEDFLEPELGPVLQAPLRVSAIHAPVKTQVSYASLLHNTGFDDERYLAARLRAWREIMREQSCDLLVAEHAPTAVAAAHSLGLPAIQLGSGFIVPPLTRPFPVFTPALQVSHEVLLKNEATVLSVISAAYKRLGLAAPESLLQVFGHAQPALITYAELDHYGIKRDEPYLGLLEMAQGTPPEWPAGTGPKLFAYLRPSNRLEPLLTALQRMPARVLVRVAGIAADRLHRFERPGLRITDQAVNIQLAAQRCDAFINYGAHGTTTESLLAGKPILLLPNNVEQSLVALRAQQLGAALVTPSNGTFNLSAALRQLVDDPALQQSAEKFSARYQTLDRSQIIPALAQRAITLISNPSHDVQAGV